jgi:DNA-binding transcriptional ArsR family regulator
MTIGHRVETLPVEVVAGTGPALLVALSAASARPRAELPTELAEALDAVGDTAGGSWLNLFGLALDAGPPYTAERLIDQARRLAPVELRRHLLGRFAWSWCTLIGTETLDAAAAGDTAAFPALLEHPRYYSGRARESLAGVIPLEADETQRRIVQALEVGHRHLLDDGLETWLSSTADAAAAAAAASADPIEVIEHITSGYRYTPEPEAEQIVLVPHGEPEPWLVLAQHRDSRLVVYSTARIAASERLAAAGRALADQKRLEILALLGSGTTRMMDLVAATGLARSTVHHHLVVLREARLLDLEGNARAYRYVPRAAAPAEVAELLEQVLESRS